MLKLSPTLQLDEEAVTRKFAFIGISGSGKTFGAGLFVEQLYAAGAQTVVVDVIGNWWGLRLAADGKRKGIPIYVFGGLRGDVPLEPTGGRLVADTIVDTGCSVVLDISDMLKGEQRKFVTEFSTQLLKRRRRAPAPMQVVWEECQDVVPEYAPGPEVAHCVDSVSRLTKQGRNFGIGSSFITQRPQAVAKEVLNQVECLFMFATSGAHETKALRDWIGAAATQSTFEDVRKFDQGECFVWSPAWLKRFEKIRFAKKTTYDASATPKFGSAQAVKQPEPLDLAKISAAMAETLERAKENDPTSLRQEIGRLKAEIAKKAPAARVETKTVEHSVITPEDWAKIQAINERLAEALKANVELKQRHEREVAALGEQVAALGSTAAELDAFVRAAVARTGAPVPARVDVERFEVGPGRTLGGQVRVTRPARASKEDGADLRAGARRMLEAVASLDPRTVTRDQVALLAGMTSSSGTFSTYLGDLRKAGYIVEQSGGITLSPDGWAYLGGRHHRQKAMTHDDLMQLWEPRFRAGARSMLKVLAGVWPAAMARADLAKAAGIEASSGTFSTYLGDLRKAGVMVDHGRGFVCASNDLFPT